MQNVLRRRVCLILQKLALYLFLVIGAESMPNPLAVKQYVQTIQHAPFHDCLAHIFRRGDKIGVNGQLPAFFSGTIPQNNKILVVEIIFNAVKEPLDKLV